FTVPGFQSNFRPLIEHYNDTFTETTPFLRGDSVFALPTLYELCEEVSVYYVIRLKSNANLQRIGEEVCPSGAPTDTTETECYYTETEYRAKSWDHSREVIVQSVRPVG